MYEIIHIGGLSRQIAHDCGMNTVDRIFPPMTRRRTRLNVGASEACAQNFINFLSFEKPLQCATVEVDSVVQGDYFRFTSL